MMLCFAGSYILSFTPSTTVRSSFFAGAEMMTFFTVPRRCLSASLASVKLPVDSMTISAPSDSSGSSAGSLIAKTLILRSPTVIVSPSAFTSTQRGPEPSRTSEGGPVSWCR